MLLSAALVVSDSGTLSAIRLRISGSGFEMIAELPQLPSARYTPSSHGEIGNSAEVSNSAGATRGTP